MDNQKRFDQIESMLVDLLRKQDQQSEQLERILRTLKEHREAINSLGELLNGHTDVLNGHTGILNSHTGILSSHTDSLQRQELRLDAIGEQIGDVVTILKLSEARHTETERRQDAMLAELTRVGQRSDAAVEGLRILLQRQQTTDTRLDSTVQTQLQLMQLMRLDADTVAELARRFPALEGQEPRIQRLEDQVFRAAS
ncbi:MAG: hypothetical protein ACRYFK_07105 [Janthinobacterium lividum]